MGGRVANLVGKLASIPLLAAFALSACTGQAPVTPKAREMAMQAGQSRTADFDVAPPAGAPRYEPIDIVFLFDGTGSMGGIIGAVQRSAGNILEDISKRSRDVRYAVAEFGDYPGLAGNCRYDLGRPVWRLVQDFSADAGTVGSAIDSVGVHWHGCDTAEAYLRALEEARRLRWRPGAARYVVLLGDAPARSPDPGRDEVLGTPDDLSPGLVASAFRRDRITLIGIYASNGGSAAADAAASSFAALANPTPHGLALPLKRDRDVRELIRQGLVELPPPPPALILATPAYRDWVGAIHRGPLQRGTQAYKFGIGITPPPATGPGVYRMKFDALTHPERPASAFGSAYVTIRIGWQYYPLKPLLLLPILLLAALALWPLLAAGRKRHRWGLLFGGSAAREFLASALSILLVVTLATLAYVEMPPDAHSAWVSLNRHLQALG